MKSSFIFKLFVWAFLLAFCANLWAFLILQALLLLVYAGLCILAAITAFWLMQEAKRSHL